MASRFHNPPNRAAQPDDIHPEWCSCSDCSYDYDLAHRSFFRSSRAPSRDRAFLIGLLLAVIAAGAIAAALGGGAS